MNNYEAITTMTPQQMEVFLDSVLLTGANLATYAASMENGSDEQLAVLDANPYNADWLSSEAEDATKYVFSDDNDIYLPDALCHAIFNATGIQPDK